MSYEKMISRTEPGLLALLLDDSGSIADHLPGTSDPKYAWNERYFGLIVKELLGRCTEVKGTDIVIRPRYYFHIASYGSNVQVWGDEVMDVQAVVEKYTKANNSLGLGGRSAAPIRPEPSSTCGTCSVVPSSRSSFGTLSRRWSCI